jgi:hypothetical protein
MMREIITLYKRQIITSNRLAITFLSQLSTEYIAEHQDNIQHCKKMSFTIYQKINEDNYEFNKNVELSICSAAFKDWLGFHNWCSFKAVDVFCKKKKIDEEGIWWPSVIEIAVNDDNELLFLHKLLEL